MKAAQRAPQVPGADHSAELEALRVQLAEAQETIAAIRSGAVDALLSRDPDGERVYTLQSADRPYRVLVETMLQGALICEANGSILFANGRMAELLGVPHECLPGKRLSLYVAEAQRPPFERLLKRARQEDARGEVLLARADGALIPVHLTLARMPAEGAAACCVIVTDLTPELTV